MAGSSWTRVRCRGELHDADGEGDAGEEDQTLGHHGDHAARGRHERGPHALVLRADQLADEEDRARRDDRPSDPGDDPVDLASELGARERELLRLSGQARHVGIRADLGHPGPSRTGDHEAAGHELVARLLHDGIRLAGEQRLVDLQRIATDDLAVGDDLAARAELHDVVEHDLVDAELVDLAVADDQRLRGRQHRELVERVLGPQLLDDPDQRVGDDHEAEEGVLPRAAEQHDRQQDPHEQVEAREDVRPDDVRHRPRRRGRDLVDQAATGRDRRRRRR